MNEAHIAYQIRQHLNRGLHHLDQSTLDRLAAARANALAHQKVARHESVLVGIGHHFDFFNTNRPRRLLATFAILAGLLFAAYWNAEQHIADLEEVDSELLSDDLPINAYLDKGFDTWLKHGAND